jgi:hypothetical protein
MPAGPTPANASPIAVGPSKVSESAASGSGGTRLAHTSSASASGGRAIRVVTFEAPQDAAAAMHSARPASETPAARPVAISAIPANATTQPASCRAVGRSPSTITASPSVNIAWHWRTSEARPAGTPRSMPTNSRPNCPTPRNSPIRTTKRAGTAGRRTKSTAGNATSVKRSAANSSGGSSRSPTSMTTKFRPHTAATTVAMRMSRRVTP